MLALEIDPAAATNKEELDGYKVCPLIASSCVSSMPVCVVSSSGEPESCLNCGGKEVAVQISMYSFARVCPDENPHSDQERLAKKERMNDEHATAYISAGPMAEDVALQNASSPAITKETKVGPH